jgi:hypothetical protein
MVALVNVGLRQYGGHSSIVAAPHSGRLSKKIVADRQQLPHFLTLNSRVCPARVPRSGRMRISTTC